MDIKDLTDEIAKIIDPHAFSSSPDALLIEIDHKKYLQYAAREKARKIIELLK